MSRLNDLLRQLHAKEPELAGDIEREVAALADRRAFGLNFERHVPEAVELPGRAVRRADKVRVVPSRGQEPSHRDGTLMRVVGIDRAAGSASLESLDGSAINEVAMENLVVVAQFRDPIYPGLISTGKVERGGSKPFHTVINAENYHALEVLLFTQRGKVDAIYIDPPYNTGARDWKYNNDYIESDDIYRHSKWLAFMERRLLIARDLLNPLDSVLIVTIDEKEYLRLGLLLEQVFPEGRITMVTSAIASSGNRRGTFGRAAEYIFFVQFGESRPRALPLEGDWNPVKTKNKDDVRWSLLLRSGTNALRTDRPNQFYPVFIRLSAEGPEFVGVGDPYFGTQPSEVAPPPGTVAIWPIRQSGEQGRWQVSGAMFAGLIEGGYARLGPWKDEHTTIYYLKDGERKKVDDEVFATLGRRSDGSVITDASAYTSTFVPTDIWRITSHDAGNAGSRLLERFVPGGRFPFPKSLYAVEDALRFFVADKPNAVIVDYFAGSGTTAHAVMRLNKEDGGSRSTILITNNEVAAEEQRSLRSKHLRPGDLEWEQRGICENITKPRVIAAVRGTLASGTAITGSYGYNRKYAIADGFEENVEFFTLTYEAPLRVASNREFAKIAPLLWIRAGSRGRRIDDIPSGWDVADSYGVLADLDQTEDFLKAVAVKGDGIVICYIVTDEDRLFESVSQELPDHIEPVRLYESYLRNFEIESGRGAL